MVTCKLYKVAVFLLTEQKPAVRVFSETIVIYQQ